MHSSTTQIITNDFQRSLVGLVGITCDPSCLLGPTQPITGPKGHHWPPQHACDTHLLHAAGGDDTAEAVPVTVQNPALATKLSNATSNVSGTTTAAAGDSTSTKSSPSADSKVQAPLPGGVAGRTINTQNSDCADSDLGYACAVVLERGVIHWSVGTALPDNVCTKAAASRSSSKAQEAYNEASGSSSMVHFAFQGFTTGWVGLSLTAAPGKMAPADAVIGWIRPDGLSHVQSYYVTEYAVAPKDVSAGWASSAAVVQASNTTVVCFSRLLSQPLAKAVPVIASDGTANGEQVMCPACGHAAQARKPTT